MLTEIGSQELLANIYNKMKSLLLWIGLIKYDGYASAAFTRIASLYDKYTEIHIKEKHPAKYIYNTCYWIR